jgi:hypothetical protein
MNDDFYDQHSLSDWFFSLCVAVGSVTVLLITLAVTL